jgi:hypothetical protein
VTVTNGVVPDSNSLQFNSVGTFYWQASYSGDANNDPAKSVCTSETLVVGKAASSIATDQFIYPNDTSTVSETVTGNTTGDVKFRLFDNLANCQNDDGTDDATVYWTASYSGDAQHNGRNSNCVENTAVDFTNDPGPGTAPYELRLQRVERPGPTRASLRTGFVGQAGPSTIGACRSTSSPSSIRASGSSPSG